MTDKYILWCNEQKADEFPSLQALSKAFKELEDTVNHAEWLTGEKIYHDSWAWSINFGPKIPIRGISK